MNLRQAKKTLAKKVWDAAGMAGGDFAPKWVGQGIPSSQADKTCFDHPAAARTSQTPRQRKMILTNCAACAAPLAHDAPRCIRCKTRYCNKTCQHDHWRRGHKQICKRIHRGGNAEQYYADKKYKEAVAEAVEKCADDTREPHSAPARRRRRDSLRQT